MSARLAVLVVGVVLGLLFANLLNAAIGIRAEERHLPEEPSLDTSSVRPAADLEPVAAVVVPPGDPWLRRAGRRLASALARRTGRRPELAADRADTSGRVVSAHKRATAAAAADRRSFAVSAGDNGLTVTAGDRRGLVAGYYWLADAVATGKSEGQMTRPPDRPAVGTRLVDLGGVGVPADPEDWDSTNYSHNSRRFADAVGFSPPYVDEGAFAHARDQYVDYVDRMRAYGNNGLVQGGFLDLVDFDRVGDGHEVYPADSDYRARADAVSDHMDRLWHTADRAGMDVYLSHTELALTPPLRHYLRARFGSIDTEDPRLWKVYAAGLAELFSEHPAVDGIVLRVGEAGGIYDPDSGLRYSTRLDVRTDKAVRTMLRAFVEVAERYDREVIFRSWTVGIGQVGDLHSNPDTYRRVLGGLDSPHLIVSTKYVGGDFYRFLGLNQTLEVGGQRRIVEMQDRLEFEGFMAFPDLVGPLHGAALAAFLRANPRVEGVWQWTQNGGPQQAGPLSLYPFHGFWLNDDANVYTTSRLARDPTADPGAVTADWVRRTFGDDPAVVEPLVEMLSLSREAAGKGLYISAFANERVHALGLTTTPMMWIFEWDIVSGSNSVLSVIYDLARDDVDSAVAEGDDAVRLARRMRDLVDGVDPSRVTDPAALKGLRESMDYEVDLMRTLAAWRTTFLRYYQWLDTGDSAAHAQWQHALDSFQTLRAAHVATYGGDLDFPAYNFFAVDRGLAHATRTGTMAWAARGLLLVLLAGLVVGAVGLVRRRSGRTQGLAGLARALVTPGHLPEVEDIGAGRRALLVLGPLAWFAAALLVFSSFASVHFPVLLGMMTLVFAAVLATLNRRSAGAVLVGVAAPLLALGALFMAVTAVRGPGMFWYRFWTSPDFRTWFATLALTLLVWTAYAGYAGSRHGGRHGRRRAWALGSLLVAAGAVLVAVGAVPAVAGLETMLTGFNNEMAILPLGLSKILGITTHLGIPSSLPAYLMAAGAVPVVLGAALLGWSARRETSLAGGGSAARAG